MTPIASFHDLTQGRLVFPAELNGIHRKPHPLDTLIRWASSATWDRWSTVREARLWEVVALHLYLEPAALPWSKLIDVAGRERSPSERSVATIFSRRLARALQHLATGNLPSLPAARPEDAVVQFGDFAEWARVYGIALPPSFPGRGVLPLAPIPTEAVHSASADAASTDSPSATPVESPPIVAATKDSHRTPLQAPANGKFMRVQEVSEAVGYSVSSVWRLAREDNAFPKPVKISSNKSRMEAS